MNASPLTRTEPVRSLLRTGARTSQLCLFTLETWSRLRLSGEPSHAADRARELAWVAENMCALHGVRAHITGPLPTRPCVLVANHITYFDPLVVASVLPLVAIAKHEIASWPVIGELARRLGTMFVSRDDGYSGARCLREAARALTHGVSVLVFPEGTTTRGGRVLPFKRGIFGVAARARVPVVPICLRYDRADAAWIGDDAFVPHYMKSIGHTCTRVEVQFLPAIDVQHVDHADAAAATARGAIGVALRSGASEAAFSRACTLASA